MFYNILNAMFYNNDQMNVVKNSIKKSCVTT